MKHGIDHGPKVLPQPVPCAFMAYSCARLGQWCFHVACREWAAGIVAAPVVAAPTFVLSVVEVRE